MSSSPSCCSPADAMAVPAASAAALLPSGCCCCFCRRASKQLSLLPSRYSSPSAVSTAVLNREAAAPTGALRSSEVMRVGRAMIPGGPAADPGLLLL